LVFICGVGCSLNPQPLPPEQTSADAGAGGPNDDASLGDLGDAGREKDSSSPPSDDGGVDGGNDAAVDAPIDAPSDAHDGSVEGGDW
jgi:hypothetical protein